MSEETVWLYTLQLVISCAVGLLGILLGVSKRKPSMVSLSTLALVELGLLVQLIMSVVLVSGGARAATDTVEFFSYLVVALIIPIGAGFWALVERTRWSTMVIGVAGFTVAIMLYRMHQIWFG